MRRNPLAIFDWSFLKMVSLRLARIPITRLVVLDVGEEQIEISGCGLEVGVHITDIWRLHRVDSRLHGRAQSAVAAKIEVEEIGVAAAYLADTLQTGVGRAVVDKQHACGHARLRQKDAEPRLKG